LSSSVSDDGTERVRNIVQGVGYLTLQYVATSGLGFIFIFALIRIVPNFQYGIYSAVQVTVTIAGIIAILGLNLAATRFVALKADSDERESWYAARKILLLSLLLSGLATAFYLALSPIFSEFFAKSSGWTWAFLLGAGWVFTGSIAQTMQGVLQGRKKYARIAKILFFSRLGMVAVTLAVLFFYRSIEFALIAWVGYYAVVAIWSYLTIANSLVVSSGGLQYSTILQYSIPLGVAAIISVFSMSSDSVVVGGYLNASSLGIYQAAVQVSTVLGVIAVTPLMVAFFPEISGTQKTEAISNGVRLAFRFISLAVLPVSLLVAGVSTQLLDLFTSGGVYLRGSLTLELIGIFYIFVAIQTVLLYLLQGVGRTFGVIVIGAVAAATDIGVALLLVPHFGLAGAVSSKVAVSLDGAAVAIYICRSYMQKMDGWKFYAKAVFSSALPFIAILLLSDYYSARLITLVPYAVIFTGLYLACIKLLQLLTTEDKTYLVHVLPGPLRRVVNAL